MMEPPERCLPKNRKADGREGREACGGAGHCPGVLPDACPDSAQRVCGFVAVCSNSRTPLSGISEGL